MSLAANNLAPGRRPGTVALVAGERTMRDLGPVVRALLIGLLDEPLTAALVCPGETDTTDLPTPPVEVFRYDPVRWPFFRARTLVYLAERLRAAGVGLLHALDADALAVTQQLARRLEVEYVASIDTLAPPPGLLEERGRALLASSEPIAQLLGQTQAAAAAVHLVRPGVHAVHSADCFTNRNYAPALVAAGPFDDVRAWEALLAAFALLRQAGRECTSFLVGGGRAEHDIRQAARKLGLMTDLTFVDRQSQDRLAGILQPADVFIYPVPSMRVELDLLEAMAAGVPVVTAPAPAADFVIDEETALTFPAADPAQLAERITRLMDDIPAARAQAEKALARLHQFHSPAGMVAQTAEVYRQVLTPRLVASRPVGGP